MPKYPPVTSFNRICFDIETVDPKLKDLGPGIYRHDGYLIGCAITDGAFSEYYPLRDEVRDEVNFLYLAELLKTDIPKIGFNLSYDIQWLQSYGMKINGHLYDAMIAEALLDEDLKSYALGPIATSYGYEKLLPEMRKWLSENNLPATEKAFAENLKDAPEEIVKAYNISDVHITLKIMQAQLPRLKAQGLNRIFRLENDLIRVGLLMRETGVRINQEKRDKNANTLANLVAQTYRKAVDEYDLDTILLIDAISDDKKVPDSFNFNSSNHVGIVMAEKGDKPPFQDKDDTKYSITQDWLKTVAEHSDLAGTLLTLRKADKLEKTFLRKAMYDFLTDDGLIHCTFHSTKDERNGTRSGRYSSSKPNLQQVPSLSANIMAGRLCRECFIPFSSEHRWAKYDYSQLEYRIFAHYATGEGAEEIRQRYNDEPDTDYHQYVIDHTGLRRRTAKVVNFSKLFGSGNKGMADTMGVPIAEVVKIMKQYDQYVPAMSATLKAFTGMAEDKCFTRTALGRRSRFNQDDVKFYRALSRTIQGTAAEVLKVATANAHAAGIFDVLLPHMTVHDELDVSVPQTKEGMQAYHDLKHEMETAIDLRVPLVVESEIMDHWGDEAEYRGKDEGLYTTLR